MAAFASFEIAMTSFLRLPFKHTFTKVSVFMLLALVAGGGAQAQTAAGPAFADVPEEVSVRFMFKNSGNTNMVGSPEIPVIVSVVLTNKSESPLTVFVTRYMQIDDDKPLDYPLGCSVRITDAKGTALCQHSDHPDGYWTAVTSDAKEDTAFRKDSRNRFEVPSKERRAFNIPLAVLLAGGGTDATWPVVDGKFIPGVYRFKVRWAGKESPEFSLTIVPK